MADRTRVAAYSGIILLAGVAAWLYSDQPVKTTKKPPVKSRTAVITGRYADLTLEDYTATFDKPGAKLRNIFLPLVKAETTQAATDQVIEIPSKVPAELAAGDPNWAYTGMAVVNGSPMALLENSANHQSGFVKEGETWKSSQLRHISPDSVTFVDKDGKPQQVLRYVANAPPKEKAPPDSGFHPLILQGPIGSTVEIRPVPPGRQGK